MRAQGRPRRRCPSKRSYPNGLWMIAAGLGMLGASGRASLCAARGGGSGGGNHASYGTSVPETNSAPARRLDGFINAHAEQIDFVRCAGVNWTAGPARRRREAWLRVLIAMLGLFLNAQILGPGIVPFWITKKRLWRGTEPPSTTSGFDTIKRQSALL